MKETNYLNILYNSNTKEDFFRFYSFFKDRTELINWMKNRKKSLPSIIDVPGDDKYVVVIPTIDSMGSYASNCKLNLFNGLHIIFVESGHDAYFNYAHNLNLGFREAMKFHPDWVIFSNDDMYSIDKVSVLKNQLTSFQVETPDVVYTNPAGKYHSYMVNIGESSFIRKLAFKMVKNLRYKIELERNFSKLLSLKYFAYASTFPYSLLLRYSKPIINIGSFGVFSYDYIKAKGGSLFDETYINGYEDLDLSLRLRMDNSANVGFIKYRIEDIIGGSLGKHSSVRTYRSLMNLAYFNQKLENKELCIEG